MTGFESEGVGTSAGTKLVVGSARTSCGPLPRSTEPWCSTRTGPSATPASPAPPGAPTRASGILPGCPNRWIAIKRASGLEALRAFPEAELQASIGDARLLRRSRSCGEPAPEAARALGAAEATRPPTAFRAEKGGFNSVCKPLYQADPSRLVWRRCGGFRRWLGPGVPTPTSGPRARGGRGPSFRTRRGIGVTRRRTRGCSFVEEHQSRPSLLLIILSGCHAHRLPQRAQMPVWAAG
jgi:hypothetical protein